MNNDISYIFTQLRLTFESLEPNTVLKGVDYKDFMYMGTSDEKGHMFKHSNTRNYIYLKNGSLTVPVSSGAFHRGVF